jgi:hypothetical protein
MRYNIVRSIIYLLREWSNSLETTIPPEETPEEVIEEAALTTEGAIIKEEQVEEGDSIKDLQGMSSLTVSSNTPVNNKLSSRLLTQGESLNSIEQSI